MNYFQIILGLILWAATSFAFSKRQEWENQIFTKGIKSGANTALTEPLMLPFVMLFILLMLPCLAPAFSPMFFFAKGLQLFLQISVYYGMLLLLSPLLRKAFSARACADFWILPTLLYFSIYLTGHETEPLLALPLPRQLLAPLGLCWLVGFLVTFFGQLLSHFQYRHFLLQKAKKPEKSGLAAAWYKECRRHGRKKEIPILISPDVNSPLTLGCFEGTMRLFLPREDYSPEELNLIFCHELRHILRADTRMKLFLGFFSAVCWFNPLAWIARRKAAEDLELSCDEGILTGADEKTRLLYAELLLKNAGDNRGYTTSLSAGANSLRYRLRHVVKPAKRLGGGLAVGAAFFVLILSVGSFALTDSADTVGNLIFQQAPAEITVDRVTVNNWNQNLPDYHRLYGWQEEALTAYLAALTVRPVYAGNYREPPSRQLYVDYGETRGEEVLSLTRFELCDHLLFVNLPYDNAGLLTFLLEEEIDWTYLESLLDFQAEKPLPASGTEALESPPLSPGQP